MSKILKVSLILVGLVVVLYFVYTKFFQVKSTATDPSAGKPDLSNPVAEKPGDVNLCAWLNNTYPKMKTGEFNDIDGGAHNPEAKPAWISNKCSLIF